MNNNFVVRLLNQKLLKTDIQAFSCHLLFGLCDCLLALLPEGEKGQRRKLISLISDVCQYKALQKYWFDKLNCQESFIKLFIHYHGELRILKTLSMYQKKKIGQLFLQLLVYCLPLLVSPLASQENERMLVLIFKISLALEKLILIYH